MIYCIELKVQQLASSQYSYTSFTCRPIIHLHTSHTMAPVHFLRCQQRICRPMWLSLWALDVAIWTIMVESVLQIAL